MKEATKEMESRGQGSRREPDRSQEGNPFQGTGDPRVRQRLLSCSGRNKNAICFGETAVASRFDKSRFCGDENRRNHGNGDELDPDVTHFKPSPKTPVPWRSLYRVQTVAWGDCECSAFPTL